MFVARSPALDDAPARNTHTRHTLKVIQTTLMGTMSRSHKSMALSNLTNTHGTLTDVLTDSAHAAFALTPSNTQDSFQ